MLNINKRYADIRIDAAFKICFGTEANKDNMIGLLGLLIPDAHIVDITFMDKEFPGFVMSEKTTIFDVYCKTEDGRRIIVEMQLKSQRHFVDRAIYYSTYPLREQLSTPMETDPGTIRSYGLRPVYTISIVDFSLDHDDAERALTDGLLRRMSSTAAVRGSKSSPMCSGTSCSWMRARTNLTRIFSSGCSTLRSLRASPRRTAKSTTRT
ncbi:MAG: Rpn family recombination-promoting nuclease/putative transposase [Bacteroidales bacterium]|nr:Rpn family recombination-promoting nuclease/putative transposase [Bacteroidales bacterium]